MVTQMKRKLDTNFTRILKEYRNRIQYDGGDGLNGMMELGNLRNLLEFSILHTPHIPNQVELLYDANIYEALSKRVRIIKRQYEGKRIPVKIERKREQYRHQMNAITAKMLRGHESCMILQYFDATIEHYLNE